jgi:diacylglycerol kinase family enzyme
MAYILGVFTSIIMCDNQRMRITVDDKLIAEKTCLVAIGNGKYYGGGMKSLPDAITDDGLFDVCHVGDFKRLKILRLFPRYMKGRHTDIKGVSMYRGKKVDIILDKPLPMNLDGEIILAEKASFEMIHRGLPFVFPKL